MIFEFSLKPELPMQVITARAVSDMEINRLHEYGVFMAILYIAF